MTEIGITYRWYQESYGGDLSEVAFASSLPAGKRHVSWLCGGKEPKGCCERNAYKRAVCAAVEAFACYGEGQVGGFAIGDFKMTHYEDEGTTGVELATDAILAELAHTSLLFTGMR